MTRVCVCPQRYSPSLLSSAHHRLPGVFLFDKTMGAFFQAPSKLPIVYRALPLRVNCRELPRIAAASGATHRSPSCCLKVVQVRPVFEHPTVPAFHRLIESFQERQACCPTFFSFFFFQQISHRLSDVSSAQLSSPQV